MIWQLGRETFKTCYLLGTIVVAGALALSSGCSTIRVTDPPRTADEEFLLTSATERSVSKLALDALRDRSVWIETTYALSTSHPFANSFLKDEIREPSFEELFVIAELRSRLLRSGVRLAQSRDKAQVVLEIRIGAVAINREDFLVGIPSTGLPAGSGTASVAVVTPEIALYKKTSQQGYASVAFVAYWADSGELVALSGPFVGVSNRRDSWLLGVHVFTDGDIPPTAP